MYNYITDHTATFKLSFLAITNTITRFKYSDQIMKKRGEKLIMELIEIKGSGLTCDNKNCDYVDKTVYTISNDVNKKTENLGSLVKVKNFIANNIIC